MAIPPFLECKLIMNRQGKSGQGVVGEVYALDRTMMTLPKQYSEMRGVLVDAAIFSAFLIRLQANRRLCSASLSFQVCT